jgi:glycosyltransferase involved in cell wall biosynthesis
LVALARARPGSLVIAPHGITREATTALRKAKARVITTPIGAVAAVLMMGSSVAAAVSAVGLRTFRSRRWTIAVRRLPHQVTLLAGCLAEASALRTARIRAPNADAVVILTASEALHGLAALLGGQPHLRFVHEVNTTEDLPLRLVGRLARRAEARTIALYPTTAVAAEAADRFPCLAGQVRTYAIDDGTERINPTERARGRTAFAIPDDEPAVCLVGGWWPHKDLASLDVALGKLRHPLHLLVAGRPLDEPTLDRWRQLPYVRLHLTRGPVGEQFLRLVYAAADAALVVRRPGITKESGLVMDSARYGVPLLISDHDPALTAVLQNQPWAHTFTAGDPTRLAEALRAITSTPLPQPGLDASRLLGMWPATEQADFFTRTHARLLPKEPRC